MVRNKSKLNTTVLLVFFIISCIIIGAESKHNGGKQTKQKSFLQEQPQKSNKFHSLPLKKTFPSQEYMIETINLLKHHQALLLEMNSYSYLEITSDKKIVKKERDSQFNSFLQTDMKSLKQKQSIELRNRDNSYFTGRIEVGKQPFDVIFDTGSAFVFIDSDYCEPCMQGHNYYTVTDTLEETNLDVQVQFGTGQLTGILSKDIVQFGDITIQKGVFAQITEEEGYIFEKSSFDGIVGLSVQNLSDQFPTMLDQLNESGQLEKKVISFFLERDEIGSQITIGGIDKSKYDGEMKFHSVIDDSNFWTLACRQIRIGNEDSGLCSDDNICRIVIDSGTSFFTGPPSSVTNLLKKLNKDNQGCKNLYDLPTITFVVEDSEYTMYPNEYILTSTANSADPFYEHSDISQVIECMVAFYGLEINDNAESNNTWILGDVFMGKYYSVFDSETKKVGFARSINYQSYIH